MISPDAATDPTATIRAGVTIHHFSVVCADALIGADTSIGHNVFVGAGVSIGSRCRIQGNVFIPPGIVIQNDVFIGPGVTFCNVKKPEPFISQEAEQTVVGASSVIGAGAVILPGLFLCSNSRVGAGAVVTKTISQTGVWYVGNPAKPHPR